MASCLGESQPLLPRAVTCAFYSRRGFPSDGACSAGPRARACLSGELLGAGPLAAACAHTQSSDAAAARQDVHVYIPLPGRLPPRLPARTRVRLLTRRARCVVEKVRCCQQISNASTFAHIFGECVYFYANCLLKCFAYFPIRFSVVLIGLLAFFTSSRYNFFFWWG